MMEYTDDGYRTGGPDAPTSKAIEIDLDILKLVKERPYDPELRLHLLQGCWRCIYALANTDDTFKRIGFEPVEAPRIIT